MCHLTITEVCSWGNCTNKMVEENLDSFFNGTHGVGKTEAGEVSCRKFYAKSLKLQFYTGMTQFLSKKKRNMRFSNEDFLLQIRSKKHKYLQTLFFSLISSMSIFILTKKKITLLFLFSCHIIIVMSP